jgi:two-component system sensor histidine kinase VicK
MNKLLEQQIKRFFGGVHNVPSSYAAFIQAIDTTYTDSDRERILIERSMALSSQELLEANQNLREESEALKISQSNAEKERAKAECILSSIGDGVFAVDLNGFIILMNPVAEELSGFTFQEGFGRHYTEIFRFVKESNPDGDYPPFIEEVIKTKKIWALQNHTLMINKNNVGISISDSAAPVLDKNKEIFGCIVIIRDASKERALEKSKDEFISIAAHQLRTPLGSARWHTEMLLDKSTLDNDVKEKIKKIYQSNLRMIILVNDLLNVSNINRGITKETPVETDINGIITTAIQELTGETQTHQVTITSNLSPDLPKIVIDPRLFLQVVQNLLSNAIKYSPRGSNVIISVTNDEDNFIISVSDQGIGIPTKDQPRVFSEFYRAENVTKSDTTGSGLGLFVVKSYVERWGGKVSFISTENKGTTFTIELPKQHITPTYIERRE